MEMMNFIEVPEWLDSYDEMIKLLCAKINDASESTVFSISDGTSAFIIVLNFKRKISTSIFIKDKSTIMLKIKNEYLQSKKTIEHPILFVYEWILQNSSAIVHADAAIL